MSSEQLLTFIYMSNEDHIWHQQPFSLATVSVKSGARTKITFQLATPKATGRKASAAFALGYVFRQAHFIGALQMMAGGIGKKDAVRNAAIRTNVHLGEPEEPIGFGLTVDPLRLRVRRMGSSLKPARGVSVYL